MVNMESLGIIVEEVLEGPLEGEMERELESPNRGSLIAWNYYRHGISKCVNSLYCTGRRS